MSKYSKLSSICVVLMAIGLPLACASDDDDKPDNNAGTGGDGGDGGGAGDGGGGDAGDGAGGSGGSTGGSGGAGGTGGGAGGAGGTGGSTGCDLSGEGLPREAVPNPIDSDTTLTNDTVWELSDTTYVEDGATLTIEPCTRIEGQKSPLGTLVVSRGGQIDAVGTMDEPILFTSAQAEGDRAAGDWGGVILLGEAPNFKGDNVVIEGLEDAPENQYGGSSAAYNCGHMSYVRIEYSGFELSPGNEINGLTMGSCGTGTQIDHVMVSNTLDDCFEWFGGGFDADHLVCNSAGDDMFDIDQGFQGNLQFLFGRHVVPRTEDPNGLENDSDNAGAVPVTTVNMSNVTLCGIGEEGLFPSFGGVLREQIEGTYQNIIFTGFDYSLDARDDFGTEAAPHVELTSSVFHDMNVGTDADAFFTNTAETDNDNGFDEAAWLAEADRNNTTDDPGFGPDECLANPPEVMPSTRIDGDVPGGGLDDSADFRGAFEDGDDDWMTGMWVDWSEN